MESENLPNMLNVSARLATTATAFNFVRNVTSNVTINVTSNVTRSILSNAYEWRLIIPPYILIFMLSISGNLIVIATLACNKNMRTVTNIYLLNLAISDFMLGVFCVPFTLIGQIYRRFLFGPFLCRLIPFFQALSVSVDVWTLVAISLERYCAICRPLKSRKWQTKGHAYKMITIVWLMSISLTSPILTVSTLLPMREAGYKCREVWPSLELERAFNLGLDAVLLIIPIVIMGIAYSLIGNKLWRGMKHEMQHNVIWQRQLKARPKTEILATTTPITEDHRTEFCCEKMDTSKDVDDVIESECLDFRHVVRSTNTDKSIKAKRKVIIMLVIVMLKFFVCWTPLHIINTIYLFYPKQLFQYVGSKGITSLQMLAFCSSFTNPITYCFMNRRFREACMCPIKNCKLFRRCFAKRAESVCKHVPPPPTTQDLMACVVRSAVVRTSNNTGRSDVEGQEKEECV